jgi:acyl-CoA synthetase (AMP-forming)/AMP-acid ligase II
MNFSQYCQLNASKFPKREFLIECIPSRRIRRSITWEDFNDQTNAIANHMIKNCHLKKGDVVLQFMTNSIEWYVIYMGILKAGGVVSPLNFRFAAADVKYAADVAKCKVFAVDETLVQRIQPVTDQMDYVEEYIFVGRDAPAGMTSFWDIVAHGDWSDVLCEAADEDMAELMFTSGTTGAPKPVCHTHGSLRHIAIGNALTFNDGYNSVCIAPHPFYHSGSLFYSFPSYMAAGKVLMPMELQPASMIAAMAAEKATGGWVSVPIWADAINAIKAGEIKIENYDLSALRYIVLGGQPVPYVILEDVKDIFPKLQMMNSYGITEGGGGGTVVIYDEDIMQKAGSIGKATAFMEVKVVDGDGKELPSGRVGELLLKGPRLMKEYAYNPELTAKTITDGWLHTGDLAYKDTEGFVFFADRAKDLIIRGGENIFPAEIEDVIRRHPKVRDVAVIGYPHPRLVEVAMAVIQLESGAAIGDREVIDFCRENGLAKYKWPEKFVYGEVPRNPAGKIEKPKLRSKYVEPVRQEA